MVLPDSGLDDYQKHAIEVWAYAEALHNSPDLFLGRLRQILKTLADIRLFASSLSEVEGMTRPSGIEAALQRMSKGPTFAGYKSPHLLQANWSSNEQGHVSMPPVVSFVMDTIATLRELKRILTDNTC